MKKQNPTPGGAVKAADWIQELCWHYAREDKRLKRELLSVLEKKLEELGGREATPLRQGVADTIKRALDYLKNPPPSSGSTHSGES